MTPVSNRPVPAGYTEKWNKEVWHTGFVYRWSEVCEGWLDCDVTVTVKPGQALCEAFEARMNKPMLDGYTIFFIGRGCNG